MLNIAFIYIVLLFIVMRFSVTVFNFLSNPKLGLYGRHFSDPVSVIIEMTENSDGLNDLLSSLQRQDYQQIEVLIQHHPQTTVDQRILNICANDARFQLLERGEDSSNITEAAAGKYLLFLRDNTIVNNGLINSLIYRTKVFNLSLLTVIPTQTIEGAAAYCLRPLDNFVLLNLVPLRLVRLVSSPVFSAGSNQCMFFKADDYSGFNWQRRADGKITDGLEVVKAVKQEGFNVDTLLGSKMLYSTSPESGRLLFLKTGKRLLRGFGNNNFAALLYLLVVVAGPIIMLFNYEYSLLILPAGLIFLSRVMISFLSRQQPLWNILLHPIQMLALTAALLVAMYERLSVK